ncbi:MAG TPA: hypothetical protein EYH43_06250 [Persephonella sp.]|nr:hypothetical protein [Hydrogenothermaceae bacterium]HIQ25566.1 hypothetical protein [Persephonella sp.]
MNLKIFKKLLLIGLFFFSVVLSSTHHHYDLKPHYDCPICVFQINDNSEEPNCNLIKLIIPEEIPFSFPINYKNPYKILLSKANQRAPPVYM